MKVKPFVFGAVFAAIGILSTPAHAVDGCKLLLCLAGNWKSIGECTGTVREAFRDMAKGRPFPTCSMSGAGNGANNTWADQSTCPTMYREYDGEGYYSGCRYPGRIQVNINGALWSQVFWDFGGNTSTWYTEQATQSLTLPGATPMDDTFKADLTQWNANISQCKASGGTPVLGEYGEFASCTRARRNYR